MLVWSVIILAADAYRRQRVMSWHWRWTCHTCFLWPDWVTVSVNLWEKHVLYTSNIFRIKVTSESRRKRKRSFGVQLFVTTDNVICKYLIGNDKHVNLPLYSFCFHNKEAWVAVTSFLKNLFCWISSFFVFFFKTWMCGDWFYPWFSPPSPRPDITFVVDWALNIKYRSTSPFRLYGTGR